jgi:hypothetical protein
MNCSTAAWVRRRLPTIGVTFVSANDSRPLSTAFSVELHVFVGDVINRPEDLALLKDLFAQRNRTDEDFWLVELINATDRQQKQSVFDQLELGS